MPYTNIGDRVGTSKVRGLIAKYNSEGSEMKLLEYGQFLHRAGGAPFVTKDINTGEPVERDIWWKMYVDTSETAVQRRIDDVKRITKFIASPKGILWESEIAALETIQKNYQDKQQRRVDRIRSVGTQGANPGFWKSVLNTLANLGRSVLQGIGLTASTLEQVAVSGTGAHVDTYISRAYLKEGDKAGVFNTILSYAGLTNGGNVNGAAAVLGGSDVVGNPDPAKLMVPDEVATAGRHNAVQTYGTGNSSLFPSGLAGVSKIVSDREDTRNYKGDLLNPSGSYSEKELHGVSQVTGSSENKRGPLSNVRNNDLNSLGNRYGSVRDKSTNVSANAAAIAKNLEPESAHYIKDTSIGQGKEGWIPYGVELNSGRSNFEESGKKVYTRYPNVDAPESYIYGGNPTKEQFDSEKGGVVDIRVSKPNVGLTKDNQLSTQKDSIFNLVYNKDEAPVISLDKLEFDNHKLLPDLGLIPFCITTITPDHRTYLNFPAYLESYDDSYDGEWNSVQYIGRAENFYGYKGFKRSISLSFKVLARNIKQLEPLYRKLNRLVGATAPSYDSKGLFMRGTLASLTVGGTQEGALLRDQLGFVPNVKLSWESDVPWEINYEDEAKNATGFGFVVPHALNVSMTFTPIEKQEVREDYGAYFVFDPGKRPEIVEESKPVGDIEKPRTTNQLQLPVEDRREANDNTVVSGLTTGNIRGGGLTIDQQANHLLGRYQSLQAAVSGNNIPAWRREKAITPET